MLFVIRPSLYPLILSKSWLLFCSWEPTPVALFAYSILDHVHSILYSAGMSVKRDPGVENVQSKKLLK